MGKGMSQHRRLDVAYFVVSLFLYVAHGGLMSLHTPLLSPHFQDLDIAHFWVGVLTSLNSLVIMVSIPRVNALMKKHGRGLVFFSGWVVQGFTNILFGYADAFTNMKAVWVLVERFDIEPFSDFSAK